MLTNIRTLTCALIFASATLVIPGTSYAKTQIPTRYQVNAAEKYDASAVQQNYVALAGGLYNNALAAALTLSKAIDAFKNAPTAATLDAARAAWTSARNAYLETEAFRFYGGPIDGPKTEFRAAGPELLVDANFLLLERALWGSNNALIAQLAAKRASSLRQGEAIASAASSLQNDLAFVLKEWDPIRRTGYAQEFLQLEGTEAIGRILRGLGMQALAVPKVKPSDARSNELAAVLTGMHSMWHAQLNKISAPSIETLLSKIDPNAAAAVTSSLARAQTQANAKDPALPETLQKLALALANAGTSLGVAIAID